MMMQTKTKAPQINTELTETSKGASPLPWTRFGWFKILTNYLYNLSHSIPLSCSFLYNELEENKLQSLDIQ